MTEYYLKLRRGLKGISKFNNDNSYTFLNSEEDWKFKFIRLKRVAGMLKLRRGLKDELTEFVEWKTNILKLRRGLKDDNLVYYICYNSAYLKLRRGLKGSYHFPAWGLSLKRLNSEEDWKYHTCVTVVYISSP